MLKEFKNFAMRGNVIDLTVGVIIGAAFNGIITSIINDVITPLLLRPAFTARLNRLEDLTALGGVKYGKFMAASINFLIIAFVLFLFVKLINKLQRKEEIKAEPPADVKLLTEIRDLLKK